MNGCITKPLSSSTSMPSLVTRLDRLDSMMRYLEGKKDASRCTGAGEVGLVERELVPLGLAVKETQSKGSILDQITRLEARLVQLLLDVESEAAASQSKSIQTEQEIASPRGSIRKGSHSFSIFKSSTHGNEQALEVCIDTFDVNVEKRKERQQKPKNIEVISLGKKGKKMDERASQKLKKIVPSNWLHFRLLGC